MKRFVWAALCLFFGISAHAATYNILDFGAAPDGKQLATKSIQSAIDACAAAGGGVVHVPAGDYLVGTISLRSNVEFRFETGARLIATTDLSQYTRHSKELDGVFYTEGCTNVSITGNGVIFGQGMEFMETDRPKRILGDVLNYVRQGENFRRLDAGVGDGPLNPKERFHQMIVFSNCTDVRLSDFTCIDAPYWTFVLVHCDRIKVHGLTIDNNLLIPNSDGLDIISSSNVDVSDCCFSCGDDAIVLAGYAEHFGDPGFRGIRRPSKNINVSNCILRSRSSAIRIGGWDQNPMSNYNFSNIVIYDSNCGINMTVRDSGGLDNVCFSNIRIETRLHSGDWWGNGEPIKISAMRGVPDNPVGMIRNIHFTNVTALAENSVVIYSPDESAIENVTFSNFEFRMRTGAWEERAGGNFDLRPNIVQGKELFESNIPVVYIEHAKNICFNQGIISWDPSCAYKPYHTHAVEAVRVDNLRIHNTKAEPSPSNPKLPVLSTRDCSGVEARFYK